MCPCIILNSFYTVVWFDMRPLSCLLDQNRHKYEKTTLIVELQMATIVTHFPFLRIKFGCSSPSYSPPPSYLEIFPDPQTRYIRKVFFGIRKIKSWFTTWVFRNLSGMTGRFLYSEWKTRKQGRIQDVFKVVHKYTYARDQRRIFLRTPWIYSGGTDTPMYPLYPPLPVKDYLTIIG